MGRRLILDTNTLIAYERGTIDRLALDEDDLSIAEPGLGVPLNGRVMPLELGMAGQCHLGYRRETICLRMVLVCGSLGWLVERAGGVA